MAAGKAERMAKCFLAYDFGYELDLDGLELRDIAVAVQDKISRLQDRRERYHDWLKFDAPADYVPNGLMWSQYDEERLQRLENLMAEIADRGAVYSGDLMEDHTAEVAAENAYSEAVAGRSYIVASEIWKHMQSLEEFGCSGVVVLQKSVFDDAVTLLSDYLDEKLDHLENAKKMVRHVPINLVPDVQALIKSLSEICESLDDVLPYLSGAFTVNFHPGSEEAAGKEGA